MFNNPYSAYGMYGNSIPTATQPYGYPINNYSMPTQAQNAPTQNQTNTNKIFVNGIDDVRNRMLPTGSDFIFLDNDKPILYQKVVDGKGQFEVKAFTITPYNPQAQETTEQKIDLSQYAKIDELKSLQNEIKEIKERLFAKQSGGTNGNGQQNNTKM